MNIEIPEYEIHRVKKETPDAEKKFPAIYQSEMNDFVKNKLSSKYTLINTSNIIDYMTSKDWTVTKQSQTNPRKHPDERTAFVKHMVRLRSNQAMQNKKTAELGHLLPEIVIVNSHEGTASLSLHGGIFRLVCSNGLITSDSALQPIKLRHVGIEKEELIEHVNSLMTNMDNIYGRLNEFKKIPVTQDEALQFAHQVKDLMWLQDEKEKNPENRYKANIPVQSLIKPRRKSDAPNNLWNLFNNVQENVMKGGIHYTKVDKKDNVRYMATKPIKSASRNLSLNKTLWDMTEALANTK